MPPNNQLQHTLKNLPNEPGVYQMLDHAGTVIYVGKAINLKKRVLQYFQKTISDPKTLALIQHIDSIQLTTTRTENEALLLENQLIKRLQPKYNILLRDDKTYPSLFIQTDHPFPRISIYRGKNPPKTGTVFGPYPNTEAVHEALNLLQKCFKLRYCRDSIFSSRQRPCLQYQIKRCSAPCTGLISQEAYQLSVKQAMDFLKGRSMQVIKQLSKQMDAAVEKLAFEEAARIRDQIQLLRQIQQTQPSAHPPLLATPSIPAQLDHLAQVLAQPQPIERIACFDISHTQGQATVASCVALNSAGLNRSAYRRFSILGLPPGDDCAALKQAITRHFKRLLQEDAPLPDLLLIDGGKGQVNVAQSVLQQLGLPPIRLLGITKGLNRRACFDRIYDATTQQFMSLESHDIGLHLLQQLRDEAHRFALYTHRKQRTALQLRSTLEDIEGIGPKRRRALLTYFGGFQGLQKASYEDLLAVPGISPVLAERLFAQLHAPSEKPKDDTTAFEADVTSATQKQKS